MKKTVNVLSFKIDISTLNLLVQSIKDLTKLNDEIYFNISSEHLLLFSYVGKNIDSIHAFKMHKFRLSDIFTFTSIGNNNTNKNFLYIVSDGKKMSTSLNLFIKYMISHNINEELDFKIFYNDEYCERLLIENSKSKEEYPGTRAYNNYVYNINVNTIDSLLNRKSILSFKITKEDMHYIVSKISIETNDVLFINVKNNKVNIGENRWQFYICDIECDDIVISFPKKYLKSITYDDDIDVIVFDNMVSFSNKKTHLLISTELYAI